VNSARRSSKPPRREDYRAIASRHHAAAAEPGRYWYEWKKLCHCKACEWWRGEKLEEALAGP
jgi:hypothetical protein